MSNLSPAMAKASRQLLFSVDAIAVFIFSNVCDVQTALVSSQRQGGTCPEPPTCFKGSSGAVSRNGTWL